MNLEYEKDGYLKLNQVIPKNLTDRYFKYFLDAIKEENINNYNPGFANNDGDYKHLRNVTNNSLFKSIVEVLKKNENIIKLINNRRALVTHAKISFKKPMTQSSWHPHSDLGYKESIDFSGITIAVPLDRVGEMSGGIHLFPGSHKVYFQHEIVEHPLNQNFQIGIHQEIMIDGFKISPLYFCIEPGDVLLWDLNLVHASGVNNDEQTLRPILIFEVQFERLTLDDYGNVPVLLSGKFSPLDLIRLIFKKYYKKFMFFYLIIFSKIKNFCGKVV